MRWFAKTALSTVRWAVIDCETSGLDAKRGRLLSLGACAVRGHRILAADSFSAVLQQPRPSGKENILIHGIGADAQLGGLPAEGVLREFKAYLGDAVAVAFHAPFDAEILRRAFIEAKQPPLRKKWLDLAQLAPALFPARARTRRLLDDWLQEFDIAHDARHDALADAFATAQFFLVLLAEAERQGLATLQDVLSAARNTRWLGHG